MKKDFPLTLLIEPLADLKQFLAEQKKPWIIIGGVATSLLGRPRFTADVDIVVLVKDVDIPAFLKSAVKFHFKPRMKDAETFAAQNRVLLLQHTKTHINLDVSLGLLPFEREAIQRRKIRKIGDLQLPLPTVEDLIIYKAVAHRPVDMQDIRALVKNKTRLDVKYLKKNIQDFAKVLEAPEIWKDIKEILDS